MTSDRPASNVRLNTIMAGWVCIAIGAGMVLSESSAFSLAVAAPLSIGGVILLVVGIGMEARVIVGGSAVAGWTPEQNKMPDAGRPMYRVDTTLLEPIRTSILCGRCAHLEWVEGGKPKRYICSGCGMGLWESEEE